MFTTFKHKSIKTLVAPSIIVIALIPSWGAVASFLPSSTSLGSDLDPYFSALQEFVAEQIWSYFEGLTASLPVQLKEDSEKALQKIMGSMGFPNPQKMDDLIWAEIPDLNEDDEGVFTPLLEAETIVNSASIASNQAIIDLTLSEEAQEQQKQVTQQTNEALTTTIEAAQSAQDTYVTQDILKLMSVQNAQTAILLKAQHDELYNNRVVAASSAFELVNLNKQEQEKEWQQSIESTSSDVGLFDTVTQFTSLATAYSQEK
ncbi:hypothetical protein [Gloeothece verrucosa]|uniref:Uncharacterized protein n=1 Tax=Gloeothece verrucosa (strain PCC 7822) TaxID=497965 RepID=E0UMN9_GLOV7|nr:hypothetical protein [Gloeothece verrucosa]ADN18219.1 hypothetical protein Cyan7822_6435 [Gloeothece verrucosa PCC 7822]